MRLYPIPPEALAPGSTFLQSSFWGRFKARFGWQPWAFSPDPPSCQGERRSLLVLRRRLLGPIGMAYIPHPPEWAEESQEELSRELLGELPLGTFFLRYDLLKEKADPSNPPGRSPRSSLRKAPMDIQPSSTTILDLAPSEEELLAGMKSKTRYNIRLASRKGVAVEQGGREGLDSFYGLYRETAERDSIAIHSRTYYEALWEEAAAEAEAPAEAERETPAPDLRIYLARHEGEPLAAIVTLFLGGQAVYLYGASSNSKRNLMPAYALQWQAIRDARAAGCREYDFFGIPPAGEDKEHPMHGLYRFKTGFGGRIVHREGCWDFPYSRLLYGLYRAAEGARRRYYKGWKKRRGR